MLLSYGQEEAEQSSSEQEKLPETAKTKLGKTHVDYWPKRLEKHTFVDQNGKRVDVPDWQVRIQHLGRVAHFNLKTGNGTEAAAKARDLYVF